MRRRHLQILCFGLLPALPAWAVQQGQTPPPAASAKPQATPAATPPQQDTPLKPASVPEDIEVGEFYIHKGDIDAAIPRFEDAIRQQPALAKPRLLLGEAYEKKDDRANAVKCYKAYLEAFPNANDRKKIQKKIENLEAR